MNSECETTSNFEEAIFLSERVFSHKELVDLLKNGNVPQKQIAALKFDEINSQEDAKALVDNLTGCDGKIREAVALKINQLLTENTELSQYFIYPFVFAKATIDINANICRLVVDSVSILSKIPEFANAYLQRILEFIGESYKELDNINFRDKKYVINKQLFKLYWCLETLKSFIDIIDENILYDVLMRASCEQEYTIREKAAQIVIKTSGKIHDAFFDKLANDENYYVRSVFNSKR